MSTNPPPSDGATTTSARARAAAVNLERTAANLGARRPDNAVLLHELADVIEALETVVRHPWLRYDLKAMLDTDEFAPGTADVLRTVLATPDRKDGAA